MNSSRLFAFTFPTSRRAFVVAASVVASAGAIAVSSIAGAGANDTSEDPTGEVVPSLAAPTTEPISSTPSTAVMIEQITFESEQPTAPVSVPADSVVSDGGEDGQPASDWDGCPACGMG